jgi:uncharacterized protein (TIGR02246 family)
MNPCANTPLQAVQRLIAALNAGDLDDAVACYAPDATFIPQPDIVVSGRAAIRVALTQLVGLNAVLRSQTHAVFESTDTALYCASWSMEGTAPDGSRVEQSGKSSDVLRRQPDGSWLIAIDNPYGAEVLPTPV